MKTIAIILIILNVAACVVGISMFIHAGDFVNIAVALFNAFAAFLAASQCRSLN